MHSLHPWRIMFTQCVCALSLLCASTQAWGAAEQYYLIPLDPGRVYGVAKEGAKIVGAQPDASGRSVAYQFSPNAHSLGLLPGGTFSYARATLAGRTVGEGSTGDFGLLTHAWVEENGTLFDISDDGRFSAATSLNYDDVCGYRETDAADAIHPACWLNGTWLDMPTLGGPDGNIHAVNEVGTAIGASDTTAGDSHCTYWPVTGGTIDCHPANGGSVSYGTDINSAGLYVAQAFPSAAQGVLGTPFGPVLLPHLEGNTFSFANTITDANEVGGKSCRVPDRFTEICDATLWLEGVATALQPRVVNAAGWQLQEVIGMSNDGLIVVHGTLDGQPRPALLTPIFTAQTAPANIEAFLTRSWVRYSLRWQKLLNFRPHREAPATRARQR